MSLVRKYFISNFRYKSVPVCGYFINESRVNCAQYYTCLNNPANIQSRIFKYEKLQNDNKKLMSIMQDIREKNFNLSTKIKNFAEMLPTYIPFAMSKHKRYGYFWFKTLDEIDTEAFFSILKMPDTFYSRFQVIELHAWMLLCHLPKQNRIHRFIRLGLIEAMWQDSQKRAKLVSSLNVNYKKNFRDLYGEFVFAQLLYDYCFMKSDTALASALWCSFFNKENVDPRILEALVGYTRYQMHHLNQLDFVSLNMKEDKGSIWAPPLPVLKEILGKS